MEIELPSIKLVSQVIVFIIIANIKVSSADFKIDACHIVINIIQINEVNYTYHYSICAVKKQL